MCRALLERMGSLAGEHSPEKATHVQRPLLENGKSARGPHHRGELNPSLVVMNCDSSLARGWISLPFLPTRTDFFLA